MKLNNDFYKKNDIIKKSINRIFNFYSYSFTDLKNKILYKDHILFFKNINQKLTEEENNLLEKYTYSKNFEYDENIKSIDFIELLSLFLILNFKNKKIAIVHNNPRFVSKNITKLEETINQYFSNNDITFFFKDYLLKITNNNNNSSIFLFEHIPNSYFKDGSYDYMFFCDFSKNRNMNVSETSGTNDYALIRISK